MVACSINVETQRDVFMQKTSDNILTIQELSSYLKIPKSTLYKLTREGKIPFQKVGRHLRFHREAIDEWVKGQDYNGEKG